MGNEKELTVDMFRDLLVKVQQEEFSNWVDSTVFGKPEYVDEWTLPEEERLSIGDQTIELSKPEPFYIGTSETYLPDEPPPDLCMYSRPVLTGIAIPDVRGFLGPKEINSDQAWAQRDAIQTQRREESLQAALKQYKRTHREWPTCRFGGEVHGHIHKAFTGELQLALECDECSAIQEDLDWYEENK
jgi:hypothetical protein